MKSRNGIVHVGVMEWIERNGGDPATVQYVELPFPQMPPAITNGSVDAALRPSDPCAISGFISTDDRITKNRDAAAAAVIAGDQ